MRDILGLLRCQQTTYILFSRCVIIGAPLRKESSRRTFHEDGEEDWCNTSSQDVAVSVQTPARLKPPTCSSLSCCLLVAPGGQVDSCQFDCVLFIPGRTTTRHVLSRDRIIAHCHSVTGVKELKRNRFSRRPRTSAAVARRKGMRLPFSNSVTFRLYQDCLLNF